jgi:F0F1-type ATP synthase membrane subunit a
MTLKLVVLAVAALGITPAVLWALVSLVTSAISVFMRPVSLSFRLHSESGSSLGVLEYHELPVLTSLSILAGATLLIFGIGSISRPD